MSERLTSAVRPQQYTIKYTLDFETFTFDGEVEIVLRVTDIQNILRLHCEKLTVSSCELRKDSKAIPVSFTCNEDEIHITGEQPFTSGDFILCIRFSGSLSDDLSGLYRSRYVNANGATEFLATTQFEAPYARKALPCFDEPEFKATFSVTMDIPSEMTGISNMPIVSEKTTGDRKTILFDTTPPMSTYLLYCGAGIFDYIEEKRGERIVRVYGVNGKSQQGAFALTFAADTLEFFERYTGVPYPLPKLDLIAIPDFAAGAMENWGAVTFREVLLYVDDTQTSLAAKKRIAEVVAHELWHQWSGNLVTMEWWDDLWLNEAFATYNAYRAVDHFYPDWHIWDDFTGSETQRAFDMDMLSSTHPIGVTVETPNQIEEIFDGISYGKGGSVLCMIEHYIGEESFRRGVAAYLKAFAYKNATARDLWDTLERYSGKQVKDILSTWIMQPGFPLITVEKNDDIITLHQNRFSVSSHNDKSLWPVPLTWSDGTGTASRLMDTQECKIEEASLIMKFNAGQTGFYRTLYQPSMYRMLYDALGENLFSVHDRWGIIDDLWAGVLAGYAELPVLLDCMDAYNNEDRLFILEEIYTICTKIALYLQLPENGTSLYLRYRNPFSARFDRLGWEPSPSDSPEEKQLRSLAIGFLVASGNRKICNEALSRAERYCNGTATDPDIRNACLSALARSADLKLFEKVIKTFERKTGAEEKLALLSTLAEFRNSDLILSFLDYSLSDAVRRQDLRTVFSRVVQNPYTPQLFFDWAQSNWKKLSLLSDSYFVFAGLLQTMLLTAPDTVILAEVKSFLDENTKEFESTKANAFEKAELYLRFRERENEHLVLE